VVEASIGHIMDLPKNDIGVELKNRTFEPTLIVSPGKEKVVDRLKKLAAKADMVCTWRPTRTAKARRLPRTWRCSCCR
jgi:DNA topoisomerase IA